MTADRRDRPMSTVDMDAIRQIATLPEGTGKHAAFMRVALGESTLDTAIMAQAFADQRLTEAAMVHIAQHWHDEEPADRTEGDPR